MKKNLFFYIIIATLNLHLASAQTISPKDFQNKNYALAIDGFANFSTVQNNQKSSFEGKNLPDNLTKNHADKNSIIGNDTQIYLKAGAKTTEKTIFGAVAKVEFNLNSSRFNQHPNLDQAYIFSENDFGKFELGNYFAVNQKMKSGPARFARGAGGINGKYLESVNLPMLANSGSSSSPVCSGDANSATCSNVKLPHFILLAQSPIGHGGSAKGFHIRAYDNDYANNPSSYSAQNRSNFRAIKDDSFEGIEDATKLNYYSPRIEDFQVAISYTPRSNNDGVTKKIVFDSNQIYLENIVSFGINYLHYFDNLSLNISATGEKGQVKNRNYMLEDLASYDLGFSINYFGFDVGASYGSWGKSLQPKNGIYSCPYNSSQNLAQQNCANSTEKFANPYYYTLGVAYKFGPIAASVTSLNSTFQKNRYSAISLGLDYKLKRDLMPYLEITKFNFKSNQASAADITNQNNLDANARQIRDNSGYVFLAGILYIF